MRAVNDFAQKAGFAMRTTLMAIADAGQRFEQTQRLLQTAVEDTGASYDDYSAAIDKATSAGQKYGLSAATVTDGLQRLISVSQNTAASIDLIGLAENLAAEKHMTLASAAQLVGRVYDGNVGILKRYGIVIDANTTSTEALAILQQRYAGQAEANATSLSRFTAEMTNLAAEAGVALGPFSGLIQVLPGLSVAFGRGRLGRETARGDAPIPTRGGGGGVSRAGAGSAFRRGGGRGVGRRGGRGRGRGAGRGRAAGESDGTGRARDRARRGGGGRRLPDSPAQRRKATRSKKSPSMWTI